MDEEVDDEVRLTDDNTYLPKLNLQHMAMLTIGRTVWQTTRVKLLVKGLFRTTPVPKPEIMRFMNWTHITHGILDELKKCRLSARLVDELIYLVKKMGDHMYDWYHYIERVNKFFQVKLVSQKLNHPMNIYWTPLGKIDLPRVIVDNWFRGMPSDDENVCAIYFICLLHGLHTEQIIIWTTMEMTMKFNCTQFLNNVDLYVLWYASADGPLGLGAALGLPDIDERVGFLRLVGDGFYDLVESAWDNMHPLSQRGIHVDAFCIALRRLDFCGTCRFELKRYEEIAVFLYCKMTDQRKCNILCGTNYDYVTKLLCILVSRPHLNLFMPVLEQALNFILLDEDYVYTNFIHYMIREMLENFENNYFLRDTLLNVWKILPYEIKKDIQFDEILTELLEEEGDLKSLERLNIFELIVGEEPFIKMNALA